MLPIITSQVSPNEELPAYWADSLVRTSDGTLHAITYNNYSDVFDDLRHWMSTDDGATWSIVQQLEPPAGYRFKNDYSSSRGATTGRVYFSVCLGPDDEVIVVALGYTVPTPATQDSPAVPYILASFVYANGAWAAPEVVMTSTDKATRWGNIQAACDSAGHIHVIYDKYVTNPPIWNTVYDVWHAQSTAISGGTWTDALAFHASTGSCGPRRIIIANGVPTAFVFTAAGNDPNYLWWSRYVDGSWTALEKLDWIIQGYPEDTAFVFDGSEWHGIQYDWGNNEIIYATTTACVWGSATPIGYPAEYELGGAQQNVGLTLDGAGTLWTAIHGVNAAGASRFVILSKPAGGTWAIAGMTDEAAYYQENSMLSGVQPSAGFALVGAAYDTSTWDYTLDFLRSYPDTPAPITLPPLPPSDVVIARNVGNIDITWVDNADNETGYKYKVSYNGEDYGEVITIADSENAEYALFTPCAECWATIRVAVAAYNSAGDSEFVESNEIYRPGDCYLPRAVASACRIPYGIKRLYERSLMGFYPAYFHDLVALAHKGWYPDWAIQWSARTGSSAAWTERGNTVSPWKKRVNASASWAERT